MSSKDVEFIGPRPFAINISQAAFNEVVQAAKAYQVQPYLNNLLSKQIDEEDFTYGIPPTLFLRLLDRLKDGFSWSEWQTKINDMGSHHILTVKGVDAGADLDVHFVHRRSTNPSATPLLLAHGWPGSFLEFEGISKLLTNKYHIVCPSIPGYTFSSPPKNLEGSNDPTPLVTAQVAQCFDAVMRSLGYDKYVAQGGDWGSILVRRVAHLFPQRCRALHLNFISQRGGPKALNPDDPSLSELEKTGLQRGIEFRAKGQAYALMQGTTPYTLGAVLSASPISVLAYIGEKMYRWSAPGTHLPTDFIIANSLLYWFTKSLSSSFWLYYLFHSGNGEEEKTVRKETRQPTALGFGPHEIFWIPKVIVLGMDINVSSWNVLERGGHFLAAEAPDVLAKDMDQHFSSEEVQKALSN